MVKNSDLKEEIINSIGLKKNDYLGAPSTLCTGCGHDLISSHIMNACFQAGIHPNQLVKMSGIGCSSKTPAYFISHSFSFNSMHGRMAPVSTGAKVCNPNLIMLGMSGDGDTASIGLGGFVHLIRRNLPMCYIVANNGVYGLTKGQFSSTAEQGEKSKQGVLNTFKTIDLCSLAIETGCSFVARSFSGDGKQLVPLIQAALKHNGTALIDVYSPCITFNNHDGSTKSFSYIKSHDVVLQELGYYIPQEEVLVDYEEGTVEQIVLSDGSKLLLKKIDSRSHKLDDRLEALRTLAESREKEEILTGLIYYNNRESNLINDLNLSDKPLALLEEHDLRPSEDQYKEVMQRFF